MTADLRYLNSLMGYDANRTQKFIDIYKSEIPKQLEMLFEQLELKDHQRIAILAHGIKSQSTYLRAEDVVKIARELETDALNGEVDDSMYERAQALHAAVVKVLQML